MKFLLLALLISPVAHAADVISCQAPGPGHLRVAETARGYAAEATGGRGGAVERDITDGAPAFAFHGASLAVIRVAGELVFSDEKGVLEFPESGCRVTQSDPGIVVGHGELGDGLFGECDSPSGVGYLYLAKGHAYSDAANKCPGRKAHLLGDYRLSTTCRDGSKTAVEEGIFRCDAN